MDNLKTKITNYLEFLIWTSTRVLRTVVFFKWRKQKQKYSVIWLPLDSLSQMLHFLLHPFLFHIGDIFGFLYKHRKTHLCHRERSSSSTSVYSSSSVAIVALFLNVRLKKNMQAHYRPPLEYDHLRLFHGWSWLPSAESFVTGSPTFRFGRYVVSELLKV